MECGGIHHCVNVRKYVGGVRLCIDSLLLFNHGGPSACLLADALLSKCSCIKCIRSFYAPD